MSILLTLSKSFEMNPRFLIAVFVHGESMLMSFMFPSMMLILHIEPLLIESALLRLLGLLIFIPFNY